MKHSDKDHKGIRLQVYLSHNGVCSRRAAMNIIQKGRVCVNGKKVTEPSFKIREGKDHVTVDKKKIHTKKYEYILLNKPKGYVTTKHDRFAKKTIYDLIPKKMNHLAPVGRLDKDSEGLLLLTNDGDVAYKLTHPKFNIDKTYYVCIKGALEHKTKIRLQKGIFVQGTKTAPAKISQVRTKKNETQLLIDIHEGKKRQIRIMFGKMKHKVIYLKRLRQGTLQLGRLKTGMYRPLTNQEIEDLYKIK